MKILAIILLTSSLGAILSAQTPVNQSAGATTDVGLRVAFLNKSALSQLKAAQSDIDTFQSKFIGVNQIDILLDLAELANKGIALWWLPEVDVTQSFIEAYKEYQTTGKVPTAKTPIPKARAAVLDIQALYDSKTGIKQLARRLKEAAQKFPNQRTSPSEKEGFDNYLKEARDALFKALDGFAKESGYTLVINASVRLPEDLTSVPKSDMTRAFIDKYNRLHP